MRVFETLTQLILKERSQKFVSSTHQSQSENQWIHKKQPCRKVSHTMNMHTKKNESQHPNWYAALNNKENRDVKEINETSLKCMMLFKQMEGLHQDWKLEEQGKSEW